MHYDRYGRTLSPTRRARRARPADPEGPGAQGQREGAMRGVETLMLVLIATVLFMWVVLGHSTPDERARLHDSIGDSTGIAWR